MDIVLHISATPILSRAEKQCVENARPQVFAFLPLPFISHATQRQPRRSYATDKLP